MNVWKQFGQARLRDPHGFILDESRFGEIHEVFVKCLCDWQAMHHFSADTAEVDIFSMLERDVREHNDSVGGEFGGE